MASLKSVPNIPDSVSQDITEPTSATSSVALQSIVSKVKSKVEQKIKYSTFTAYKYVKKGSIYLVRVDTGEGHYIDVKIDYRFGKANFKTAAASGMDTPLSF
uniref:Cystatin domain-containing protein n=1 Tax=Amphimedon queenslandica TaxID=400682 RepID=A0A1X7UYN2_AMPQE